MSLKTNKTTPKTNKQKTQTRDIYSTFTQGAAKKGQMSSAYQILKLYKVQSLFKNSVYAQAFPGRVPSRDRHKYAQLYSQAVDATDIHTHTEQITETPAALASH